MINNFTKFEIEDYKGFVSRAYTHSVQQNSVHSVLKIKVEVTVHLAGKVKDGV